MTLYMGDPFSYYQVSVPKTVTQMGHKWDKNGTKKGTNAWLLITRFYSSMA